MYLIRTTLRPSPIHGIGVFTEEPIQKGQLIWEFDPRIDMRIPLEELGNFPPAMQEYLERLAYVEILDGRKFLVLCGDNAKYSNHSDDPNLSDTADNLREYALRDIGASEELTCNYFAHDHLAAQKLK